METVTCNLCGSNEYTGVYSFLDNRYNNNEWFNVVECNKCGLGFVNPRPSRTEIGKYYPKSFFEDIEDIDHSNRYIVESKYLSDITGGNRRLLDIGCANGGFPRYMKGLGWEVEGVEVSLNSQRITDFKVYTELSEITLSPAYDAITAWAVLEHVHDPMRFFTTVRELLVNGGQFVFLVTNFHSLGSRYLFVEDIPRHLYFFTEDTIRTYMNNAGLEFVRADYNYDIYGPFCTNWLRYYFYKYVLRRELKHEDIPIKYWDFLAARQLKGSIWSKLGYLISNPLSIPDYMLMPYYIRFEVANRRCAIVTYIARKP